MLGVIYYQIQPGAQYWLIYFFIGQSYVLVTLVLWIAMGDCNFLPSRKPFSRLPIFRRTQNDSYFLPAVGEVHWYIINLVFYNYIQFIFNSEINALYYLFPMKFLYPWISPIHKKGSIFLFKKILSIKSQFVNWIKYWNFEGFHLTSPLPEIKNMKLKCSFNFISLFLPCIDFRRASVNIPFSCFRWSQWDGFIAC